MGAAPAYYPYEQRAPQRVASPRPRIDVVPGRRSAAQSLPSTTVFLAKVVAVVLLVVAGIACARVAMNAATVSTMLASQEIDAQIEVARDEGSALEVAQSTLSNPSRIKAEASELGMAEPLEVGAITLPRDVVATDASGNLSLSESVAIAAQG